MDIIIKMTEIFYYIILFLGSFGDTLIGLNLFVHGELFFLLAAYLSSNKVLILYTSYFVLILGALLGDNISYFLGRKIQFQFREKSKLFNKENYTQTKKIFIKYGGFGIFFSKFLGPISWVTPFIAGNINYNYKKFFIFNLLGIICGIGQYLFLGYFGTIIFRVYFYSFITILIFLILVLLSYHHIIKKSQYNFYVKLLKSVFLLFFIYLFSITLFFFVYYPNHTLESRHFSENTFSNINEAILFYNETNIYGDNYLKTYEQPINIILVSDKNISLIFDEINWSKSRTFSRDNITLIEFLDSFTNKDKLPISDFFYKNKIQDLAFQEKSNSLINRHHLRLYLIGKIENKSIYFGSISEDDDLRFTIMQFLPVLVHDINYNIDESREYFKNLLINSSLLSHYEYIQLNNFTFNQSTQKEYQSDGRAIVLYY